MSDCNCKSKVDDMSGKETDILRLLCVACCERPIGFDRWLALIEPNMKSNASKMVLKHIGTFDRQNLFKDLKQLWSTLGDQISREALIKKVKSGE